MRAASSSARARVLVRAAALGGCALVAVAAPVSAAWLNSATASSTWSTSSLAAPTGLTATQSCLLTVRSITLAWTPSTSAYATGYTVYRKAGGGSFAAVATLAGRTTASWVDEPLASSTTYTYAVRTTYQSWTASSGEASATTQGAICL